MWKDFFHWSSLVMMGMLQRVGEIWFPMVEPLICLRHMCMTRSMPVSNEVCMMVLRCSAWMVLWLLRWWVAVRWYLVMPEVTLWREVLDCEMSAVKVAVCKLLLVWWR